MLIIIKIAVNMVRIINMKIALVDH